MVLPACLSLVIKEDGGKGEAGLLQAKGEEERNLQQEEALLATPGLQLSAEQGNKDLSLGKEGRQGEGKARQETEY